MSDDRFEPTDVGVVHVLKSTEKALLVEVEDNPGEKIWIPKSQIHVDSEIGRNAGDGEVGSLVIPAWLAKEKGF